jgi:hypothetical protein
MFGVNEMVRARRANQCDIVCAFRSDKIQHVFAVVKTQDR